MVKFQLTHLGKFLCLDTRTAMGLTSGTPRAPAHAGAEEAHSTTKANMRCHVLPRGTNQSCHVAFEGPVFSHRWLARPGFGTGGLGAGESGEVQWQGLLWRSAHCSFHFSQPGLAAPLPVNLLLGPKLSRKVFVCIWKISGLFSTLLQAEEIEALCIIVNICCPHLMPMVFPS